MNIEQNHIIDKVFLEMNTKNLEEANSIKNNIDLFLKNHLFPRLEKLFDEYGTPNKIIRFNQSNIEISINNFENTEANYSEFSKNVIEMLEVEDVSELDSHKVEHISPEKNRESTFLFFLENGYLPWYGKEDYILEFTQKKNFEKSLNNEVFLFSLKEVLIQGDSVVQRFVRQFNDELLFLFLEKTSDYFISNRNEFFSIYSALKNNLKILFLKLFIQISLHAEKEKWMPTLQKLFTAIYINEKQIDGPKGFSLIEEIKELIRKSVMKKDLEDFDSLKSHQYLEKQIGIDKEKSISIGEGTSKIQLLASKNSFFIDENIKNEKLIIEDDVNEIAVRNAGLILIHPYIMSFFRNLEFLSSDGMLKDDSIELAVQTLHYISTGMTEFFEGNLILEKFLCGIPLKMPIQRKSLLNDRIIKEANTLLQETIKNWPALKNTSPNGLRDMFFNRDGKLVENEKQYKLIVERKVQDVLLEKLPWNISIVKLPWKKELLFVEW